MPLFHTVSRASSLFSCHGTCRARQSGRHLPVVSLLLAMLALSTLSGCDQINKKLGLEDPAKKLAQQEAEGKAVGGACRHSGRAIEDCYSIYTWLPKEAVFAGWKEMDTYMRENNITTVAPQLPPAPPPPPPEPPKKKKPKPAENKDGEEGESAPAGDKGEKADKDEKADSKADSKSGNPDAAKKADDKPAARH